MAQEVKLDEVKVSGPQIKLSKKKQALFSIIIFLVFLVVLEGALRLLGIPADEPQLRNSDGLIISSEMSRYKPGWSGYYAGAMVHINSAGWRGKEFSAEKPQGTVRILGVGDSFTFGRAVNDEDVFLVKLEEMLNSDGALRYETINAGHENLNAVREFQYFQRREMMKLKPDVVVLGFTVHNDAQAEKRDGKNKALLRRYKKEGSFLLKASQSDWLSRLAEDFRLARVLRLGLEWASEGELTEYYYNLILRNYEDGSETWENCRNALLSFYEACRENNTLLVFAIFPVYTRKLSQTYRDYPEAFKGVHEKLKSVFSGKDGVMVVDMLDDLAASGLSIHQIRVPVDGHPNKVWHEIVARRLHETFKGMKLGSIQN